MGRVPIDDNRVPLVMPEWGVVEKKSMTFAGGTTNDPGDFDGTGNPATLFTVTGLVKVRIFGFGTTDLVGATATLEVGTAKSTAGLIAQTTATNIDANEIWHDNAPDNSVEAITVAAENIVGQNIIQTVATANITAGAIDYYCFWIPLSENGKVEAA